MIFICLLRNLLSHFNPILFFGNTYIPWDYGVLTHSITGTSLLLLVTFPFWLVGFSYFCYEKTRENFFRLLIIFSLFVSIIPASLTLRGFDSYRSVYLLPIYYIFIIYGIDVTLKIVKIYTIDKKFILAVILSIIMAWEMFFLYSYELNVKAADDSNWQYGVRDIFRNLSDYYDKYERIFLTTRIAFLPNLYLRFYDPKNTYNKIETRAIDSCYEGNMLYVIRPDEAVGRNIDIKKIIYYPNGHDEAYYFVEFERSKLR